MSQLRARFRLLRRSSTGAGEAPTPATAPGVDPGLQLLDGGPAVAAAAEEDPRADPTPTPLHPVALRRAAPAATRPPRPRQPKRPPEPTQSVLLPEPAAEPEDPARPLRLLLVEEVPEVAAHVREMLRGQPSLRLVEVISDGRQVVREVRDLRADVVLVDTLLRGRVSGIDIMERLRGQMPGAAVVALGAASDAKAAERVRASADALVEIPFGTIDLARAVRNAHETRAARDPASATRMVAVYAAKGGVGKTTLALNLAVGLAAAGIRTALVDGSLQYGDMRRLLRVEASEPSICDLPTDCVRASDLVETMRRGPAGVDILFAPPRLEMADTVTARDLDKILDLLRRSYRAVVVDTPSALNDTTLTVLDMADVILQVLTPEPAALDSTRAAAAAFAAIGYPAAKVRVVINRADAQGGLRPDQLRRALGREPDHVIASDWPLVSASNQDGVPFVLAHPEAQISRDIMSLAGAVTAVVGAAPSRLPTRIRARSRARERAG